MPKRVLVPLDGSPQAWAALEHALEEYPDAKVTALYVIDPVDGGHTVGTSFPAASEQWFEGARAEAEELFAEARERVDGHDVELDTATEVGPPARTIVDCAEREDVDAIVMGSHGRSGVSRILLGSVAEAVVRNSSVPVTVVR